MKKFFQYISACFALLLFASSSFSAEQLNSRDIGRVLYKENPQSYTYLVLDRIVSPDTLECHYYGRNRTVTIHPDEVGRTFFYESTPPMVLSQYALYHRVARSKSNHAMNLWQLSGDTTGRLEILHKFDYELKQLRQEFSNAVRRNRSITDEDDQLDELHLVLDKCVLHTMISENKAGNDYALLITMYLDFHQLMLEVERLDPRKSSLYASARELRQELSEELCEAFKQHRATIEERQEKFLKIFPQTKGYRWLMPSPVNMQEMTACFGVCMQSYFSLDTISRFSSPNEWGAAILNTLLLIGGSKSAEELEKEFDKELERMTKN